MSEADPASTWENRRLAWIEAQDENPTDDRPERAVVRAARRDSRRGGPLDSPEAWAWVEAALADEDRRWFIAEVFNYSSAPRRLGMPFLQAGILERNPSSNRFLVEPGVAILGARKVYEVLTERLLTGSDIEKGGAASAGYWVRYSGEPDEALAAAVQAFFDAQLTAFVTTEDVDARRRILPSLSMNPSHYSPHVAPLVPEAKRIARAHDDPYIRHRIEIQLGAGGPYMALPTTETAPEVAAPPPRTPVAPKAPSWTDDPASVRLVYGVVLAVVVIVTLALRWVGTRG